MKEDNFFLSWLFIDAYWDILLIYLVQINCNSIIFMQIILFLFEGVQQITNPRILEHPEDLYATRNDPATLNCKAEGEPPPVITWYRDGQLVVTANENPHSSRMLLPSGQLFFLRVLHNKNSKQDVGNYYCNATNPETMVSVISRTARLEIAGKNEFYISFIFFFIIQALILHLL